MMRAGPAVAPARTSLLLGFVAISSLATLVALPGEPAFANRMVGTNGADTIVGTAKPDQIKAWGGNDQVNGRQGDDRLRGSRGKDRIEGAQGRDRLSGGKGADRLNAVDGKKDLAVNGGPGNDVCTIDRADRPLLKSCETAKVTSSGGGGGGKKCIGEQEAKLQAAGESGGGVGTRGSDEGPPRFSAAFYAITITLDASADGMDGRQLPISIEKVCDVPKSLAKEAAQLAGGEGVAIVGPDTKVFEGGKLLEGQAATRALAGADTVTLSAQLKRPGKWGRDEDGEPVPTFRASRIKVTD